MPKSARTGLVWDDNGLGLEPRLEPELSLDAVKKVCQRALQLKSTDGIAVSFLASGAFNRLYIVEDHIQQKHVLRVSLPVDPHHKTAGEVATLRWLSRHSKIPVPGVVAFEDSTNNELKLEWILMELVPGTPARRQWRKLSMEVKEGLVKNVAEYQAQLFNSIKFRAIGTLREGIHAATPDTQFTPGRIAALHFFWGQHFDYDIHRGPFRSTHGWLKSYISIIVQEQTRALNEAEDEDDKEDAEEHLRVAQMLDDLLPKIFPSVQHPPERTVLWHDDLSLQNIMVDEKGAITAVIDWECVSTMPLWVATQMPEFLRGVDREREPRRDEYGDEHAEKEISSEGFDDLDNEGKCDLYWIHLMEYEQTQLRKVYSENMSRLWAGWDETVADSTLRTDFLGAVLRCAEGFALPQIETWVTAVNRGEFLGLLETIYPDGL